MTDKQRVFGPAIDDFDPRFDGIVGIQARHRFDRHAGRKLGRRNLGRLARAQLAALAHALHARTGAREELTHALDLVTAARGQRPLRINRFGQCVAMLKEKKSHTAAVSGTSLDLAHRCLG